MPKQILLPLVNQLNHQIKKPKISHQLLREYINRLLILMPLQQIHSLSQYIGNSLPLSSNITCLIIINIIQDHIRKRIVNLIHASKGLVRGVSLDRNAAFDHLEEVVRDAV